MSIFKDNVAEFHFGEKESFPEFWERMQSLLAEGILQNLRGHISIKRILNRTDGPAITYQDGGKSYYIDGNLVAFSYEGRILPCVNPKFNTLSKETTDMWVARFYEEQARAVLK